MAGRPVALALLMVLVTSLAGCNFRDWYDQVGTVRVEMQVVGPEDSDVEQFQSLRILVRSTQIRQLNAANPLTSTSAATELQDLARLARSGERVVLLEEKVNLRGFESTSLKLEVVDGVTAAGETLPGCEQGVRVEEPPCIRYARQGSYPLELTPTEFHAPRGGTVVVVIPLAVQYSPETNEYFIATRPAQKIEP